MLQKLKYQALTGIVGAAFALAAGAMSVGPAAAQTKEPIKIGFGMSLTGPLSANGKMSLVAMQVWEDDINAKGGLLGRPVKLVYYDDQSNPSQVPAIYTKLLDIDKVDLIVSGYASGQIAPAMPIAIQKKKLFMSLFGTGINETFNYSRYFSMIPNGPTPKPAFTRGFFKVAEVQKPKPQTIAIAMADAEFGRNACEGAHENAVASGFKIITATTPVQQQMLKTLPASRVSAVRRNGQIYFVYPVQARNVLYVGKNSQYLAYQQLAQQRQEAALVNQEVESINRSLASPRWEAPWGDWDAQ